MKCPIKTCPIELQGSQLMCRGHWALCPRPIQQDVYTCFRKRRGGPTHVAAIQRAIKSVESTLAGWVEQNKKETAPEKPVSLPYRDD